MRDEEPEAHPALAMTGPGAAARFCRVRGKAGCQGDPALRIMMNND
jgi:hypothetical protein